MKINTLSLVIFLYLIGLTIAIRTNLDKPKGGHADKPNGKKFDKPNKGKPDSLRTIYITSNNIMNTIKNKLVDKNISPEILKEILDTLAPITKSNCVFTVDLKDFENPEYPIAPEGPTAPKDFKAPEGPAAPEGPEGPEDFDPTAPEDPF